MDKTSETNEELLPPSHIGDGLYLLDQGWCVNIAVNHHLNTVAVLDMNDIDTAIKYLQKVKKRINSPDTDGL